MTLDGHAVAPVARLFARFLFAASSADSCCGRRERPAVGIALVLVNGEAVWRGGAVTGARPGRVLRRQDGAPPAVFPTREATL